MSRCAHCETEIPSMAQYYQWNGRTFCKLEHLHDWAENHIESQDKAIAELVVRLVKLHDSIFAFPPGDIGKELWAEIDRAKVEIAKHRPGDSHAKAD